MEPQITGPWAKSTLSQPNDYDCVETAPLSDGGMAVRNSRDRGGPVLKFTPGEWDAFIGGVRLGEFDRHGRS